MTKKGMTREQMEAVGLLSIGTFLEYFDLMLYVHMSVLLNDLFFPKTDPTAAKLLAATAFCTTYLLRPIGGLVIGKIGDIMGRKFTIMLTTFVMATACVIMAMLPTYLEIGITATVLVILCRMLQGFSSLGELTGAQVYITEIMKNPYKAVMAGIVVCVSRLGAFFALAVASFTLATGFNWRIAFWIGAIIAIIGVVARTKLRETPEFIHYKSKIITKIKKENQDSKAIENKTINTKKRNKKTILAFAFSEFYVALVFYISFIYLGDFMKTQLNIPAEKVINHNLKLALLIAVVVLIIAVCAKKIHPIKIAIFTSFSIIVFPFIPYFLTNITSTFLLFCLQFLIYFFGLSTAGTLDAIQYKYFSISNRFTSAATIFGIANPTAYITASFGLIPLVHYFGYYGILVLLIPAVIGYCWSLFYFRKLEIQNGCYYEYPDERPPKPDTAAKEEDFSYDLPDEYVTFKDECGYSTALLQKIKELNEDEKRKVNIRLIEKAIVFCKKWHDGQMRKSGDEPYYSHPLAVAGALAKYYFKTDVIVAAILHDILEDTPCTSKLIEKEFNHRIAEIVERLSCKRYKDSKTPKITLEQLIEKLEKLGDHEALFVKEIDRLHNLDTAEGLSPAKQLKMAKESELLRREIAFTADKLNIPDKIFLEHEMFKGSDVILKKRIGLFNRD